jgi:hypothetical protein
MDSISAFSRLRASPPSQKSTSSVTKTESLRSDTPKPSRLSQFFKNLKSQKCLLFAELGAVGGGATLLALFKGGVLSIVGYTLIIPGSLVTLAHIIHSIPCDSDSEEGSLDASNPLAGSSLASSRELSSLDSLVSKQSSASEPRFDSASPGSTSELLPFDDDLSDDDQGGVPKLRSPTDKPENPE